MKQLSPAQHYKTMKTDLAGNLRQRRLLLRRCRNDERMQQAVIAMCREDIVFFIGMFVWQYNAIKKGSERIRPFIPWDFQIHALLSRDPGSPGILWCIENDQDLVIEKSREMGASWLCLIVMVWLFLFDRGSASLAISRSEHAVEKTGDHKSLFWKIDFILEKLPKWLLQGYDASKTEHRQKMLFNHPNGSSITGEASTGRAGVGGRAGLMFLDEFSQIKEAREVLRRTAATASCRIFNGTHKGTGTVFAELCDPKTSVGSVIRKLVMHWSQHPDKKRGLYRYSKTKKRWEPLDHDYQYPPSFSPIVDGRPVGGPYPGVRSPWYDRECLRIGDDRGVAEDLDINPSGSATQVFDHAMIKDLCDAPWVRPPIWRGEFIFDPQGGAPKLVENRSGLVELWVYPDDNRLPKGIFVGGADVSEGVGATPTCFSFCNAETGEKILRVKSRYLRPEPAARLFVAIASQLANPETGEGAMIVWEMAGPGKTFGIEVQSLGYTNFYWHEKQVKLFDTAATVPGFLPHPDAVDMLLRQYHTSLAARHFVNPDRDALLECLEFQWDLNSHAKHAGTIDPKDALHTGPHHGDMVVADALCNKLRIMLNCAPTGRKAEIPDEPPVGSFAWRRHEREAKLQESF